MTHRRRRRTHRPHPPQLARRHREPAFRAEQHVNALAGALVANLAEANQGGTIVTASFYPVGCIGHVTVSLRTLHVIIRRVVRDGNVTTGSIGDPTKSLEGFAAREMPGPEK
jgi:hypothetical protein